MSDAPKPTAISDQRMEMAKDERIARLILFAEHGVMHGYVGPDDKEFDLYSLRLDIRHALSGIEALIRERDEAREFGEKAAKAFNDAIARRIVTCIYCGQEYPTGTPQSQDERLYAHIRVCEKHPMRALEEQRDALLAALRKTDQSLADAYRILASAGAGHNVEKHAEEWIREFAKTRPNEDARLAIALCAEPPK